MVVAVAAINPRIADASGQQTRGEKIPRHELAVSLNQTANTAPATEIIVPRPELPPLEPVEGLERIVHRTRRGDTLGRLLGRFGVPEKERRIWIGSVKKHHPSQLLPVGREIHLYFVKTESSAHKKLPAQLKALEIDLNEDWNLTWEKSVKEIIFEKREKPYDVEFGTVGGVVETSLFDDGVKVGADSALLSQLADIFTWEIDFGKDIQKGDSFKILFQRKTRKGQQAKSSLRVLAAELISSGQKFVAIYFEKEKGKGSYYDLDGRTLARAFLRFPLEFTNITSQFSHSRLHPILKVDRPHYGVDFAAKRGTPVRAVGDGTIAHAGWKKGGYGRLIEIQHDPVYASRYAHLQGLAKGIRKGTAVKKGQIIGYVGSSGRSTGAHLHFELYKDQEYIDPLNFEIPPEDTIEPALRKLFENAKQLFLVELAVAPHS